MTAPKLAFSDFSLRQLTFEIRYAEAYVLWDFAGSLWSEIRSEFGPLSADNVGPSTQGFHAGDRYTLNVTTDKAYVIDHRPLRKGSKAHRFIELIISHLELNALSRVGVRVQFEKHAPSAEAASEAVRKLGLVAPPPDGLFEVGGSKFNPTYQIELSDEGFGYLVRVLSQTRKMEFAPPPGAGDHLQRQSVEQYEIILDADLFTTTEISTDVFEPESWLSKRLKVASTHFPRLIESQP